NHHDAEDAFQATFLVLVRKADSVRPREMLGQWLHGVAHRTALKAGAMAATRNARQRPMADLPEPVAQELLTWEELRPLLDQEVQRLPARQRSVLVLCDLEGRTRKDAARQLGVPEGSVAGWLARARSTLAKRFARRGLALSAAALAALIQNDAASALMPA